MFNHLTNTQKGMALAWLGYTAFSFSDATVKYLTTLGYSVYQIIAVDCALGAALMLAFAPYLGGLKSLNDSKNWKLHGLRILLNTAVNVLIVYCFSFMSLTSVYTAVFTLPFFAALLSIPLYKERIGIHRWTTIIIGFSGILIAYQPWQDGFNFIEAALPIGTTVLIALMFLIVKSMKNSSPLAIGFYPVLGCSLIIMPIAIADFQPIASAHFILFLITGVFMSLGVIAVSLAFRMADSAVVSPVLYTELIWAIIFGVTIFGDYPDLWMLVGAGIIIVSGLHLLYRERHS